MLLQYLSTNHYEVLALQSLSARPRQLPQLPGFYYPAFRVQDEKGGARLAIYVSLGVAAKQNSLPSPQPQEGYQLATTIQTQGQDIHILNCCDPTRTRDFSWLANIPKNWLVVGDFNTRDSLWEDEYPKAANTACKKAVAEAKLQYWEAKAKDKPGDLRTMWQSLKILTKA